MGITDPDLIKLIKAIRIHRRKNGRRGFMLIFASPEDCEKFMAGKERRMRGSNASLNRFYSPAPSTSTLASDNLKALVPFPTAPAQGPPAGQQPAATQPKTPVVGGNDDSPSGKSVVPAPMEVEGTSTEGEAVAVGSATAGGSAAEAMAEAGDNAKATPPADTPTKKPRLDGVVAGYSNKFAVLL